MKILKKGVILSLVAVIFFLSFTEALLGIAPANYDINFEPGFNGMFSFNFYTNSDTKLEIYAEGDLAKYVTLSKKELDGGGTVNVFLELPKKIDVPGIHKIYIGAREKSSQQEGISVVLNLRAYISVNVPYPGHYAVMDFSVENTNIGEPIKARIKINSLGEEDVNLKGYILVYDEEGKKVQKIDLEPFSVESQSVKNVEHLINTSSYKPGRYKADILMNYEGGILKDSKKFRLGELSVLIKSYTKYLYRNQINKFDIEIESQWNNPIDNVYAEVNIIEHQIVFKTPSAKLEGFNSINLTGYFDTAGIEEEKITAKISVFYENKASEKIVKLKFKKEVDYALIVLISLGVIFVITVILLIIWIIKLNRIKNEIKKKIKKRKK